MLPWQHSSLSTRHQSSATPPEPLQELQSELSEFQTLLVTLDDCRQNILSAVTQLEAAPHRMLDAAMLQQMGNGFGHLKVAHLAKDLEASSIRLKAGMQHLRDLGHLIHQIQKRVAEADEAFARRDAAWDSKMHYDSKVAMLQSSVFTKEERLARNAQKQSVSARAFHASTEDAERVVATLLVQRSNLTAAALSKLCEGYVSVFEGSWKLAAGFRDLADNFRTPELWETTETAKADNANAETAKAKTAMAETSTSQRQVELRKKSSRKARCNGDTDAAGVSGIMPGVPVAEGGLNHRGEEVQSPLPSLLRSVSRSRASCHPAATTGKQSLQAMSLGNGLLSDGPSYETGRKLATMPRTSWRSTGSNGSWLRNV